LWNLFWHKARQGQKTREKRNDAADNNGAPDEHV
jgi:hypothetical protein